MSSASQIPRFPTIEGGQSAHMDGLIRETLGPEPVHPAEIDTALVCSSLPDNLKVIIHKPIPYDKIQNVDLPECPHHRASMLGSCIDRRLPPHFYQVGVTIDNIAPEFNHSNGGSGPLVEKRAGIPVFHHLDRERSLVIERGTSSLLLSPGVPVHKDSVLFDQRYRSLKQRVYQSHCVFIEWIWMYAHMIHEYRDNMDSWYISRRKWEAEIASLALEHDFGKAQGFNASVINLRAYRANEDNFQPHSREHPEYSEFYSQGIPDGARQGMVLEHQQVLRMFGSLKAQDGSPFQLDFPRFHRMLYRNLVRTCSKNAVERPGDSLGDLVPDFTKFCTMLDVQARERSWKSPDGTAGECG